MINPRYLPAMPIGKRNFLPIGISRPVEKFKLPILMTVAHLPLGILLYNSSSLALIHPLIVFAIGFRRAYRRQEPLERVVLIIAYIISIEILWRMAQVPIFWESGKYAASAIMLVALARRGFWKIPTLPLLYFIFLFPACLMTLINNDLRDVRDMLSFNMSGPLLLFVSCWFCTYLKVNWSQLKSIFFMLIIPLISIAVTTLFYTVTAENIQFNTESNHATSGGFGPNQVSAKLGLGVFLCLTVYLLFKNYLTEKLYLGFFTVFFAAQCVMTFSRGGMFNAIGAVLAIVLFLLLNPGQGVKRLAPVIGITAIFLLLIFPYLNDFTGGNLQTRFEESDPTNRGSIVEADFEIFMQNPIFGVGVGESFFWYLRLLNQQTASHTEFSRLLSEHGLFGIFAIVCLLLIFFRNLWRQNSSEGKALFTGLFMWSNLFMLNAGMRLAAPSFILGMCFMTLVEPPLRRRIAQINGRIAKPKVKYESESDLKKTRT